MRIEYYAFNVDINDAKAEKIIQEKRVNMFSVESSPDSWLYNYSCVYESERQLTPEEFNYLKECLSNGKIQITTK